MPHLLYEAGYADVDCTEMVTEYCVDCSDPPYAPELPEYAHVLASIPDSCVGDQRIYARGAEVPAEMIHMGGIGACAPLEPDGREHHYYRLGAELDFTPFVAMTYSPTGTTRLRAYSWHSEDGFARREDAFEIADTELGVDCWLELVADGTWRCVPGVTAEARRYFSDPTCETRITLALRDVSTCYDIHRGVALADDGAFLPIGDVYDQSVYDRRLSDCADLTRDPTSGTFYRVGEAIDVSALETLTLVTD